MSEVNKNNIENLKDLNKEDVKEVKTTMSNDNKKENSEKKYFTYNAKTYTQDIFPGEIEKYKAAGSIKSGYENLDKQTSLEPGFYVLGGASSLGKTTYLLQMADQLAQSGNSVIYISLEQGARELVSKSLCRIMAQDEKISVRLTSLEIQKGTDMDKIKEVINNYNTYSGNITIVECSFNVTIKDIEKIVNDYLILNPGTNPIVLIDYLQVIRPESDKKNTKDAVDEHVRRLKKLQLNNGLVLMVISSLNRQNYMNQIDYESFKESGGIEYTADVVWGLQLKVLNEDDFDKKSINEKRDIIKEAKKASPRKIELVCLKNRFGVSGYSSYFDYYPQSELFRPDMSR